MPQLQCPKKIITIATLTIANIICRTNITQAFSITLDGGAPIDNVYTYSVELESGESISDSFPDRLIFQNLEGVTATQASNPFEVPPDGFSDTDATFNVVADRNGPDNFSGVIEIVSESAIGNVTYDFSTVGGNFSGTVLGPAETPTTAVPFEFSSGWGILFLTLSLIFRHLKSKFH